MKVHPSTLALTLTLASTPALSQGDLVRLSALDGERLDRFGEAVAVAGGFAVVGAPGRDTPQAIDTGAIYVFDIETGDQLHRIEKASGAMFDNLGAVLAASGSTIAAGLPMESHVGSFTGSVRLFDARTGAWTGFVYAPDHDTFDAFGTSVALRGDLLVVGAPGDDDKGDSSGSAYVLDLSTGQLLHKLVASDGASGDALGESVAFGDGVVVVGAGSSDVGVLAGAAYVFDLQTGAQIAKIQPPTNRPWDQFASSMTTTGSLLVSGAPGDRPWNEGAVFVHDLATGALVAELFASDAEPGARFGGAVAAHGHLLVVGSSPWGLLGRAYLFDVMTGKELLAVTPPTLSPQGNLGTSVAVNDRALLLGAPQSRGGRGEVYLRRIKK